MIRNKVKSVNLDMDKIIFQRKFSPRLPKKTVCPKCGVELWENLGPNKIRILGKSSQEADITYSDIRLICSCGQVCEQESKLISQLERLKLHMNEDIYLMEVEFRRSPYLFDQNQRKLVREKLLDKQQKEIFKALIKYHDDVLAIKPDDPLVIKLSGELKMSPDLVGKHIQRINGVIEELWKNHFKKTVKLKTITDKKKKI